MSAITGASRGQAHTPESPALEGNTATMDGMGNHSRPADVAEIPFRLVRIDPDGSTAAATPQHAGQRKPGGWPAVVAWAFVGLIIAGLATYAGAASYESVSRLFAAHGLPMPRQGPLGLDGGLVGLVTADMLLTWLDEEIGWLRSATWLFAAGVIGANITAGFPDWVSMSLRPAAAVLFVILVEVVCTVLRRRNRKRREEAGDDSRRGISLARWMLDFPGSWRLHRRMKLWEIRSYRAAVGMELARLRAVEQMKDKYGKRWEKAAPGDLVWMLRRGVHMEDALTRVAELTAEPEPVPEPRKQTGTGSRNRKRSHSGTGSRNRKRSHSGTGSRNRKPARAGTRKAPAPVTGSPDDEVGVDTEAMILDLAGHGMSPAEIIVDLVTRRGLSPSAAGVAAGKTDRYGRDVWSKYQGLAGGGRKEPAGKDLG